MATITIELVDALTEVGTYLLIILVLTVVLACVFRTNKYRFAGSWKVMRKRVSSTLEYVSLRLYGSQRPQSNDTEIQIPVVTLPPIPEKVLVSTATKSSVEPT